MGLRVLLDDQDITDSLNKQYPLPDASQNGVFPSKKAGEWYDLLKCIDENEFLRNNFFNGGDYGVHEMRVVADDGTNFDMRILLRMKYSSRNH